MIKIWIDDVREAPAGYVWCKSTRDALRTIVMKHKDEVCLIDLDHDAGDYANDGGDFINVLKELERLSRTPRNKNYWGPRCKEIEFRLHSANAVGVQNMRAIIQANGWREVQ